jgi:hypothetical protein
MTCWAAFLDRKVLQRIAGEHNPKIQKPDPFEKNIGSRDYLKDL